jgi:hypothetical protein
MHLANAFQKFAAGNLYRRAQCFQGWPDISPTSDGQWRVVEESPYDLLKHPRLHRNRRKCPAMHMRIILEPLRSCDVPGLRFWRWKNPLSTQRAKGRKDLVMQLKDRKIKAPAVLCYRQVYPIFVDLLPFQRKHLCLSEAGEQK